MQAFLAQMPADAGSAAKEFVFKALMSKFFNQAGAEFTRQVQSIWGGEGGKQGVGVRTELKVLQGAAKKSVDEQCARRRCCSNRTRRHPSAGPRPRGARAAPASPARRRRRSR